MIGGVGQQTQHCSDVTHVTALIMAMQTADHSNLSPLLPLQLTIKYCPLPLPVTLLFLLKTVQTVLAINQGGFGHGNHHPFLLNYSAGDQPEFIGYN